MWHEARKQERMIRGMIVDYRRRAERRRDFYEKIKADPTQFLQIHGRPCKIHLDPAVAAVGDSLSVMMPWQGDPTNSIDRFDVRAHLDFIPEVKNPEIPTEELGYEERHCNYERYRILAQNSFLGISEEKFLRQLEIEEQFGVTMEEKEQQKEKLNEKKAIGAAIGYNYNDSTPQGTASAPAVEPKFNNQGALKENVEKEKDDSDDDSDLEIIDVDLSIDVSKVEPAQAHEMNSHGPLYGMAGCDLFSFLTGDADDAEQQKQIMMEEKEKALFSGRKSRRERRAQRDKRLALRVVTVPSYAVGPLPESGCKYSPSGSRSRSQSRTPSPTTGGGIQFITSFGGEDEANVSTATSTGNTSYADKAKQQPMDKKTYASAVRDTGRTLRRSLSPSPKRTTSAGDSRSNRLDRSRSRSNSRRSISMRSGSRLRCNRSRSRSSKYRRSRSRSQPTKYRISKSSSRSRSREAPRRMSRSRSRYRSYSRSCSSSGSYGYNGRHWSPLRNANQSGGVGGSGLTVPRYYGRRGKSKSSSELSIDSSESSDEQSNHKDKSNFNASGAKASSHSNLNRYSGTTNKSSRQGGGKGSSDKGGLKERLRRKMQAQLSRQLRADKKAEAERMEREHQLQQERDEEMREMAIKIRRKQREMRHQRSHYSYSPGSGSEDSRSSSPRRRRRSSEHDYDHDTERHSRRVDREHNDSPQRERRRMPVWQHEEDEMRRNEQLSVWPQRFEDFPPRRRRSCNSDDNGSPMRKLVDY